MVTFRSFAYRLVLALCLMFLGGALVSSAQETSTTTPDLIPQAPPPAAMAPATPQEQAVFSDYVNGLPTKVTLPGGKVIDLSIPDSNIVPQASMTIISTPTVPKPFDRVTLKILNYTTTLREDRITWSVNGNVVRDEIGGDTVAVDLGPAGQAFRIRVIVSSRSLGETFSKDLTINPADLAILWEADTYTPPFYRGKALPSYRSIVKLIPLPAVIGENGRPVDPKNLQYTWKRGSQILQDISGYGKTFSWIEMGTGAQEESFRLNAKDIVSGGEVERVVSIRTRPVKMVFYGGTPLQGIHYEQAIPKTATLGTQEVTISAEPYFFSLSELETPDAPITWKQNGVAIRSSGDKKLVLREAGGVSGSSRIEASISNKKRVLQSAADSFMITYSE